MKRIINIVPAFTNFSKKTLSIGKKQLPYFRTKNFDRMILEIKYKLCKLLNAKDYKVALITCSGTGVMDSVFTNFIDKTDKILIINGGRFGQRLIDMANFYNCNYVEYKEKEGSNISLLFLEELLKKHKPKHLLIQHNETSTMQLFNIEEIGELCRKYKVNFIVDACSSFGINHIDIEKMNIGVIFFGSQKGLNLPSGLGILVYNKNVYINPKNYYFNLNLYSPENNRFIEPFTPNVYVVYQLYELLKNFNVNKLRNQIKKYKEQANHFRKLIKDLPIQIIASNLSNCGTAFRTFRKDCGSFVEYLENKNIYISYSRGKEKDELIVGHIGCLNKLDNIKVVKELKKWLKSK
jgi:aspartate aminotransferase-like enzyme